MIRRLISLLTVIVAATLAPTTEAVLVAHYEFESPSNLGLDSAGGDNNGVQQGADSTFSALSRLGNGSLALDGTGTGLRLDNPADFQGLTTFTIAAFARPDLNSATWGGGIQPVGRVFGSLGVDGPGGTPFGDGNGYGFGLLRDGTQSGLRYTTYLVQDYNVEAATLANPLQDDQWAHVAVVVNEGDAEFFINGTSVATIEGSNPNPTTNPYHIGASGGGDSDSFAGLLDDVRVYDEALDASAIANLANPGGSGQQGLVFSIDRDLGAVTLTNDTAQSTQIRGYSLVSEAGRLSADDWTSISGNSDQSGSGAVDPNNDWLVFSAAAADLSEGTQGEATLTAGQSVVLGNAWRRGPFEADDLTAEILLADGTVIPVPVEFTGNGDQPYKVGDLDFDNDVDLDDFAIYNQGLFSDELDPEITDPYLTGDLDGDLDNDFFDFLTFKNAFVAEGGNPGALTLATAVPEPTSVTLVVLGGLVVLLGNGRRKARTGLLAVAVLAGLTTTPAMASLVPVFEYSFPASYDATSTTVLDLSAAGNNATLDDLAPLVDDRPEGFDSALMSITGSVGGHGATDAIDLLENSGVDDFGGFVMDVWLKWEGTFTDIRKQIDYAGTEYLRTFGGNAEFGLSDGATVLSHPIEANQWYHVQGVFDSRHNQTDENGNLQGNAFLLVDGVVVDSALGVTKTAFGDSLDRPIGINRWAGGGADWNQGWIFNPGVYLGTIRVPEPATAWLVALAAGAVLVVRRWTVGGRSLFGLLVAGCLVAPASAQFTPVFEYSFPASYDASSTDVIDLSAAGNNATMDGTAPLVDDRPAGFDASLMSITGSNGGHGATNAIDLLDNSIIDDHGGFIMDVWLKWEGTFTDIRKQIDYAGTEYLRTFGGNAQFGLSDGTTVLSHPINAEQWYHVQGVFDSGSNQTDAGGNLVGDAYLYVDGTLVDSAIGVTKTAFGDSLDRPIGINRWAGGGGDWNQGAIFNPAVYLGAVEESMRLEVNPNTGEVRIAHLPTNLLADERDIDFYQISSEAGALDLDGWQSLQDSQFDATAGGGDYNNDGTVDIADYTVWRDSLGSTGSDLAADGNGDGVVNSQDYSIWKDSFGTAGGDAAWTEAGQVSSALVGESFLTGSSLFDEGRIVSLGQLWDSGSSADPTTDLVFQYHVVGEAGLRTGAIDLIADVAPLSTSAVPEPSALGLMVLGGALLAVRRRKWRLPVIATLLPAALACLASPSYALVTNDRLYPMGEAAGDGGANGVYVVDSVAQATFDDEFDGEDLSGTAHDLIAWQFDGSEASLAPAGAGPQFVDVTGRPLAGGGTQLGVRFDGVDDLLIGARLGLPQTSASSQMSASTPPTSGNTGPFDYHGITSRGFQLWVNPDESNPVFGTAQQAVVLDTNQHGVLISDSGTWMLRYDGVDIDSQVPVKADSADNGWSHVMVVQPDVGPFGGGGQLYVDGVAVAARAGGYLASDDSPLVIGANTGVLDPTAQAPDPVFSGGNTDFFAGVVDQMNMFVLGTTLSGNDYGTFDLLEHNEFVADALAGYGAGDLTGDGVVTESDVTAFINGWGTTNLVNGIPVGDLNSRLAGDFNLDGMVEISDWQILVENYSGAGTLDLNALLAGRAVPEPATAATLLLAAALGLPWLRVRRGH